MRQPRIRRTFAVREARSRARSLPVVVAGLIWGVAGGIFGTLGLPELAARPDQPGLPGLLGAVGVACAADTRGWLGIYHEAVSPLPPVEAQAGGAAALRGATGGLRVTAVFPDSPAELGGLLVGDIIVAVRGRSFTSPAESLATVFQQWMAPLHIGEPCPVLVLRDGVERTLLRDAKPAVRADDAAFWRKPSVLLDSLKSGESVAASAAKRQRVVGLPVVLGPRPEARWAPGPADAAIAPAGRFPESDLAPLAWALVDADTIRPATEDLMARLGKCHETADPGRLSCMIYSHRNPFRAEAVAREITGFYGTELDPARMLDYAGSLLLRGRENTGWAGAIDHTAPRPPGRLLSNEDPIPPGWSYTTMLHTGAVTRGQLVDTLVAEVTRVLAAASAHHRRAFAALSDDDRKFLEASRYDLSDAFAADIYIHLDEDRERFRRNQRLVNLAGRVDYAELLAAAREVRQLVDPSWLGHASALATSAWRDSLDREILLDRKTPYGRILVGGESRHWYRDLDAAFILDLGGNDFYTGNNGGSNGWTLPVAACVDLGGNDAYESTLKGCQGAGTLGVGALLDVSGDDQYIGIQWCQGTGYFGVGVLRDLSGNDTYRGRSFCQGVGLFGAGFLVDEGGNDRYEGDLHVQGCGLPRGVGALLDRSGNDQYYAKGLYPTNYGDAGIFDAWSQGCGMGFRTIASGGLGLLIDGGGSDRMEAGNFSQGGGYYFGLGILRAAGPEDDRYIGSRYNQGFTAHEAAGVFLEDGGNDTYTTRQAVAQGLAWDECVTVFDDAGGNDNYEGGGGFSQGASAHNAVCLFRDRGGTDTYDYTPGQALAGGNDYHGGTSLSLFVDEGGGADSYNAAASGNGAIRYRPEHGFFLDLPADVAAAIRAGDWTGLARLK